MGDSVSSECENQQKRVPWYFITLLTFFVVPIIFLVKKLKTVEYPALIKAVLTIVALGYIWSYIVTSNQWWIFNSNTMLGFEVIPNLPLEEALFYPLGGALSILIYIAIQEWSCSFKKVAGLYLCALVGITLFVIGCVVVSIAILHNMPSYIISQIVLFNTLSIGLYFVKEKRVVVYPALAAVAGMTIIGFLWDWLAFTQGWWSYHAILGWEFPPKVPVDDWNFFIFAPLAAVSLYEVYRK